VSGKLKLLCQQPKNASSNFPNIPTSPEIRL
jgi:hypothetical protein